MADMTPALAPDRSQSPLARVTSVFVYLFERLLPDPFVFAILLSLVTAALRSRFRW